VSKNLSTRVHRGTALAVAIALAAVGILAASTQNIAVVFGAPGRDHPVSSEAGAAYPEWARDFGKAQGGPAIQKGR
jgi:hypothetical protein